MRRFSRKIIDKTFLKFIMVGIVNTLFGTVIMFTAYNFFQLGYWVSSALNYIFGSILSYCLNKCFTFQNKEKVIKNIWKFFANIFVCYFVAYGLAKPFIKFLFSSTEVIIQDNISMFAGMCIFVVLNYCGQRFFVFHSKR